MLATDENEIVRYLITRLEKELEWQRTVAGASKEWAKGVDDLVRVL